MTRLFAIGLACAFAAGCGPIQSTAYLLDAEVQIQAARTAGAEKLALYEWTGANLYLEKAREEAGYSDYEVAVKFAERAAKLAAEARQKAMAAKGDVSTSSEAP
ncbi:MAG: DUF4398 domain-containing protein [Myxococcaceae bacterium]|nr:DUF4398 domain-containing protein [Myxococcaceae bacterium]MCI0672870.1 DUF4398 domain-containing protein [Myxococcaceae bacterium]